jgi:hypothetical protein
MQWTPCRNEKNSSFCFHWIIVAKIGSVGKFFRQAGKDMAFKVVEFPAADVYYGTPLRNEG